jgi:uncharacterized protein
MLDCLPERVEPLGLADVGRSFRGSLPVRCFERLAPLLQSNEGELAVTLDFRLDERRIRTVKGTIRGELSLVCQRCLNRLRFPVDLKFSLGVVSSEAEIDRLPDGYEPLLISGEPIPTRVLIEDEVLLAVPAIPLHEDGMGDCQTGYRNPSLPEKENPFAVLKKLKS